jgi:hypothetical protein
MERVGERVRAREWARDLGQGKDDGGWVMLWIERRDGRRKVGMGMDMGICQIKEDGELRIEDRGLRERGGRGDEIERLMVGRSSGWVSWAMGLNWTELDINW